MSTANLFYAISEAICISIVQGILTFALIKTVFAFFPNIPSLWKYRILFGSLIFLFSGFIYAAIKFYAPEIQIAVIKSKSLTPESITMLEAIKNFLRAHSTPIFCLYSLGLFVHVLSLFSGLYKIKNLRKDRSLIQLPKWDILVNSGILKLGINQNVQLFFSEKILTPFTTGFIKPVIYFPVGMLTQLSTEQVEALSLIHI